MLDQTEECNECRVQQVWITLFVDVRPDRRVQRMQSAAGVDSVICGCKTIHKYVDIISDARCNECRVQQV